MARINLLPWREERRKLRQRNFNIIAIIVGASGLVTVGALYLWMDSVLANQDDRNKFLTDQIALMDDRITKIKGLQDTKQHLLARMQIIEQLQSSRPIAVHLFDQLVKTLPPGVYLTGVSENGDALTLDGVAESSARVSTYLRNIDASDWMGNPNLTVVQKDPNRNGAQQFSISAKVMDKAAAAAKTADAAATGGAS